MFSNRYVPIVAAALLATFVGLAEAANAQEIQTLKGQMQIINSTPDADPMCNGYVHEATKRILDNIDIDKTLKICHEIREASGRAGLKSTATHVIRR